ncbi:hypothetical protein [Nonomuraea sp. NPDC049784]|uniref:hypothetical protein n=1 Tax=Nonomuraea sp. NPDC049784 TaxID=3154361 RepID=UPI003403F327
MWWAEDGSAVYFLEQPRDFRTLRLNRMDPDTGEVTTILSEFGRAVWEILWVDEPARVVYFTASALVPEDPYGRSVCRVGLDGAGHHRPGLGRLWDHLVGHHIGAEPPEGYRIKPTPLDMDLIFGFFG